MIVDYLAKNFGSLLGVFRRKLKEGYGDLKEGYKEGLKIKCPKCKKIFSDSNLREYDSIRKDGMCKKCLSDKLWRDSIIEDYY